MRDDIRVSGPYPSFFQKSRGVIFEEGADYFNAQVRHVHSETARMSPELQGGVRIAECGERDVAAARTSRLECASEAGGGAGKLAVRLEHEVDAGCPAKLARRLAAG